MTLTGADFVELDRIAVQEAVRVVDLATDADWRRDTPCAGWTLRRLVAHMTAQHLGFAAAARGAGREPEYWQEQDDMGEPARAHRSAAAAVLGAFAEPGVTEREFILPNLGGVPGGRAVGFHFVDHVVHAWDVAAALGTMPALPEHVLVAALGVARRVPTDPARRGPGSPFAPALEVPEGVGPLEEALRLLGRSPERWPVRG
ncbi:TIGR03086 family metal-binding protein [Streptomyces sp. NPDC059680]|uniref:TIGR03086 family metal-binding protein n=1 Tax=Streptomyces TaxID=1883 RepID=UPI001E43C88C|nr:TIGR03086 family metal-binding protein [Streptomyces barringtoniae]MCC5473794.1 TIGR03086 family protein [Streptomyces barringtoniae]